MTHTGVRPGKVDVLSQILVLSVVLILPELIRDAVFVKNIGQALHFSGGCRKERHPRSGFNQAARLRNRNLHVAVKRHRRARRNVKGRTWELRIWIWRGLRGMLGFSFRQQYLTGRNSEVELA